MRGPAAAALLDLPLLQTLVLSNVELRLRPGRPTLEPLLHLTGLSHLSYRLVSVGPAPPPAWRAPAAPDGTQAYRSPSPLVALGIGRRCS